MRTPFFESFFRHILRIKLNTVPCLSEDIPKARSVPVHIFFRGHHRKLFPGTLMHIVDRTIYDSPHTAFSDQIGHISPLSLSSSRKRKSRR